MIQQHEKQFSVGLMCQLLAVSRSGYYQWKKHPPSKRNQAREVLADEVKRVFDDEKSPCRFTQNCQAVDAECVGRIGQRVGERCRQDFDVVRSQNYFDLAALAILQ